MRKIFVLLSIALIIAPLYVYSYLEGIKEWEDLEKLTHTDLNATFDSLVTTFDSLTTDIGDTADVLREETSDSLSANSYDHATRTDVNDSLDTMFSGDRTKIIPHIFTDTLIVYMNSDSLLMFHDGTYASFHSSTELFAFYGTVRASGGADFYTDGLILGWDGTQSLITTYNSNEDLTIDPNGTGKIFMVGHTEFSDTLWIVMNADSLGIFHDGTNAKYYTTGDGAIFENNFTVINGNTFLGDDGVTKGILKLYGDNATNGGVSVLYNSNGEDTNVEDYELEAQGDNFHLGPNTDTDAFIFNYQGNFTIAGATATKASGVEWANPSDIRLKEDISPINNGLEIMRLLNPVTYNYTEEWVKENPTLDKSRKYAGFIADAVENVLPNAVTVSDKYIDENELFMQDMKTLDAGEFKTYAIAAIKELDIQVQALIGEIADLKARVTELEK